MKYDNSNDAAHAWVREFNAIPQRSVQKLFSLDPDGLNEITPASVGMRVYFYDAQEGGEIIKTQQGEDENQCLIELDNGEEVYGIDGDDFGIEPDDYLPMWGTMWTFGDSCDEWWIENGGLQAMADCGFRIYELEDLGYVFGIDGAGYDFYEAHWIPLYKARGLHWHKETGESEGG